MHLELNHSIAGTWSDPVDIDSREPEIKATFPPENGGKYYSMDGLDASQDNYVLFNPHIFEQKSPSRRRGGE